MSNQDERAKPDGLTDEVIGSIYEVAIDPTRYETLLDHWEAMMSPQRLAANDLDPPAHNLQQFENHFIRADQVLDRLVSLPNLTEAEVMLSEMERSAAFVVDGSLKVAALNALAVGLLGVTKGARVLDLALGEGEAQILAAEIGAMLTRHSLKPIVIRSRSARTDRLIMLHLRLVKSENSPSFVLAVTSEIGWPSGFSDVLRSAFELTPAEVEVVRALAEGSTLTEVADERSRSVDTIRAQLKSIMSKTETRSQTELVRLTLSTMEIAYSSTIAAARVSETSTGFDKLEARPFWNVTLPDGRNLDYLILGDPNGKPVMFFPLDYGLVRWPASAEQEAHDKGMKIIVAVRPGYGNSTSIPKNQPYMAQVVDDLEFLLQSLKTGPVPFVTLGGDSFIAYSYFSSYPDRMTALIANGGVLPMTRSQQYERMDKWHRFILAGARYTPHLLPFMVKAGFALAKRLGKRGFVHAVYGKSKADVATFEIPEVFEAIVCGSEVALSESHSAHDAFSREVIHHETSNWSFEIAALKGNLPVHFLNGLQDPQVPEETLKEYQRDYPWIDFRIYPDAGQLVFFLKWRDVLPLIQRYLS